MNFFSFTIPLHWLTSDKYFLAYTIEYLTSSKICSTKSKYVCNVEKDDQSNLFQQYKKNKLHSHSQLNFCLQEILLHTVFFELIPKEKYQFLMGQYPSTWLYFLISLNNNLAHSSKLSCQNYEAIKQPPPKLNEDLYKKLPLMFLKEETKDILIWKHNDNGEYSVKSLSFLHAPQCIANN